MNITLLAHTGLSEFEFGAKAEDLGWDPTSHNGTETLLEFAGRACYQSWSKPNPKTADTEAYIRNVLLQKHLSVVEHATASFYFEDVSRSLTHELVRHRHLSFSQLSQRYVNPGDAHPVIPPLFELELAATDIIHTLFEQAVDAYASLVKVGEMAGAARKQVREAARCVLPNCTPTAIVVSGNFRSWLEFIEKRDSPSADAEIQRAASRVRELLAEVSPTVFGGERPSIGAEQGAIMYDRATPAKPEPEFVDE